MRFYESFGNILRVFTSFKIGFKCVFTMCSISFQRRVPALIHYTSFQTTNDNHTEEAVDESPDSGLSKFDVDEAIDHNYAGTVLRRPKPKGKPFFIRGRRPSEEYRQQGVMPTIDELNEAQ